MSRMKEWTVRESCEGRIALNLKGSTALATIRYFFIRRLGKTFGEIDRETKATVSHRGKALRNCARDVAVNCVDLATKP